MFQLTIAYAFLNIAKHRWVFPKIGFVGNTKKSIKCKGCQKGEGSYKKGGMENFWKWKNYFMENFQKT